jgi:hypothetical protein
LGLALRPWVGFVVLGACLFAGCAEDASPPTPLSSVQIRRELAGRTLMGIDAGGQRFYLTLRRDLVFSYTGAEQEFGTWRTDGDQLCLVFRDEKPRCAAVAKVSPARFMLGDTEVQFWDAAPAEAAPLDRGLGRRDRLPGPRGLF